MKFVVKFLYATDDEKWLQWGFQKTPKKSMKYDTNDTIQLTYYWDSSAAAGIFQTN